MIELTLPWPPSNNTYYRHFDGKNVISEKGNAYRKAVAGLVFAHKAAKHYEGRLRVCIEAHVPDKRKRDLDNLFKAPLDSLMKAGVFEDDSQIDELTIRRMPIAGMLKVKIEVIA